MAVDDWDYREVCPDGGCVGVIGPDGTCKVCGRVSPTWDNERERGMVVDGAADAEIPSGDDDDDDDDELDGDEEEEDGDDEVDAALAPDANADDYEWSRRKLCPDGACVGVVGASGACTVCGKTFA
jgi:hypothetical protein